VDTNALKVRTFRLRAAELRMIAAGIKDQTCQQNLLGMAENYDKLALSIELAAARTVSKSVH
jgi:hypothetical protein